MTGGSSGIGAALARTLARKGWHCVVVARDEERLRAVAAETDGEYELCDVGERAAVELLVNNAGFSGRASGRRLDFVGGDADRLEELFRVTVLGAVWCLRSFWPALQEARPAHVVNVASVAGTVAVPPGPYAATKHALVGFSRALAASLPREGVLVHTVNPGLVETPGFPQRGTLGSRLMERLVVGPDYVAERIVGAVERNRAEIFVPGWYRIPALAQAAAPGLVSRVLARRR